MDRKRKVSKHMGNVLAYCLLGVVLNDLVDFLTSYKTDNDESRVVLLDISDFISHRLDSIENFVDNFLLGGDMNDTKKDH